MKQLFIILSLTILYYVVLFYFDQKRKVAFKLKKQKLMGQTNSLPNLEKTEEQLPIHSEVQDKVTFGSSSLRVSKEEQKESMKLTEDTGITYQSLESEMEELALDLEAEQTLEIPQDNLTWLAATNKEEINQETIANMVASITKRKS